MKKIFSPTRFWRLFSKHTAENYSTYLMSISVLAGVMLLGGVFIIFLIPGPMDAGFQSVVFAILMLISGTIFSSTVFSDLGDKRKAIPALTLPATQLEKFFVGWVYAYPIFIAVYTGIFYLVLLGLTSLKHWPGHHNEVLSIFQYRIYIMLILFSFLQSITLFGAVFFEKLHFIKTAFCFFIGFAVVTLFNTLYLKLSVGPNIKPAIPFGTLNFLESGKDYAVGTSDQDTVWIFALLMVIAVLFWIAAYFRIKEKQI
jgi:hypothetical protein